VRDNAAQEQRNARDTLVTTNSAALFMKKIFGKKPRINTNFQEFIRRRFSNAAQARRRTG